MSKKKKHKKEATSIKIKREKSYLNWTFLKNKWIISSAVFLILIVAGIVRFIYLSQIEVTDNYFSSPHSGDDTHMYVTSAKQIIDGNFPKSPFEYNPLYYYFLALCYLIFGCDLYFPRLIQLIGGVIICLITYLIGKRVFNQVVGIISALLCAVCGTLIFHEGVLLSTALTTIFAIVSIFFFIKGQENLRWINFIFGGLFLGLATLSQPNIILFLPFILIWMFIALKISKREILIKYVIILLAFFITISPVTIRNYVYSGKFILLTTAGGFQFWLGNNEHATGVFDFCHPYLDELQEKAKKEKKELYAQDVLRFVKKDPGAFLKLQIKKCSLFWGYRDIPHQINYEIAKDSNSLLRLPFVITFGELAILGLAGLFLSLIQWQRNLLLSLFIVSYSFSVIAFLIVGRYRPPIIPPLAIFSGFTIYFIFNRLWRKEYKKVVFSLILIVLCSGIVHYQVFSKKIQPVDKETRNYIKTEHGFILKDSSDEWHGGKSAQLNSPNILLKKEFLINEEIQRIKEGTIIVKLGTERVGSVIIRVNEKILTKVACKDFFVPGGVPGEGLLGSIRMGPVPSTYLKKGINTITLQVIEGGAVAVPIDNYYNYGRSYLSSDGGNIWEKGEGEYMIELEIKLKEESLK